MKKQLILVRADLQSFNFDEQKRKNFVSDLTSAIKTELVSEDPIGILVYDKSYVENISLIEVDTQNVVV